MKIAFCGKGGVGKTLIAGLLSLAFLEDGYKVLAIDADPSPHLARIFGIKEEVRTLADMKDLLAERSERSGAYYNLNPRVEDLPDRFILKKEKLKLMVLGAIQVAGSGCACAEQAVLRKLLTYLILSSNEVVIVDMEAGVEHFGRASVVPMDAILVITTPFQGSIRTSKQILKLAKDLNLKNVWIIGNQIQDEEDKKIIKEEFQERIIGWVYEDLELKKLEKKGKDLWDYRAVAFEDVKRIKDSLLKQGLKREVI